MKLLTSLLFLASGLCWAAPTYRSASYRSASYRSYQVARDASGAEYVAGEFLVRFKPGAGPESRLATAAAGGLELVRHVAPVDAYLVRTDPARPAAAALALEAQFDLVEPNYIYRYQQPLLPDDSRFGEQWGLNNVGQDGGRADADLDAPEAWQLRSGAPGVVVAIVDSGIDLDHPDLAGNLWLNPDEIAGNGVDDDANGYVDDLHGFNFAAGAGPPDDDHRHGTHVAGIVGAIGHNGLGVTGTAFEVQLMACKFLDRFGTGTLDAALDATAYAIDNGARVINNSWGGAGKSELLQELVERSLAAGAIYVAAAGNSSSDNDAQRFYPASYPVGSPGTELEFAL